MKNIGYIYFEKLNPEIGEILTASKKLRIKEDKYNLEYRIIQKNKKMVFKCYNNLIDCLKCNCRLNYGYDWERDRWGLRGKIFQVEMIDIEYKWEFLVDTQKIKIIKEIKNTDYYLKAIGVKIYSLNKTVKDLPKEIKLFYVLNKGEEEELVYIPPEKRDFYKDCKIIGHHSNLFAKIAPRKFKKQILIEREERRKNNLKEEFEKFKNSDLCYKYFMSLYSPYIFYDNYDKLCRKFDWDHFHDYEIEEYETALYDKKYLDEETCKYEEKKEKIRLGIQPEKSLGEVMDYVYRRFGLYKKEK